MQLNINADLFVASKKVHEGNMWGFCVFKSMQTGESSQVEDECQQVLIKRARGRGKGRKHFNYVFYTVR